MLGWGISGLVTGKILAKSYHVENRRQRYARYIYRQVEPIWFWLLCTTYCAVGIGSLIVVARLLSHHR